MDPMGIAVDRYEFSSCAKKNNGVPGLLSANPMKFCTLIANPVEKDRHHVVADFFVD